MAENQPVPDGEALQESSPDNPSEAEAQTAEAPAAALSEADLAALVDRVYRLMCQELRLERLRGLRPGSRH
jgi:hypothetical protein